jgi:hypothetical protein
MDNIEATGTEEILERKNRKSSLTAYTRIFYSAETCMRARDFDISVRMDDELFIAELRARIEAGRVNLVIVHPHGTGKLSLPATAIVEKFARAVVDIVAGETANPPAQLSNGQTGG